MRGDRLLALLLLLQRRGKVTTRELAEELEVSSRTVLRDLNALSALGIPVVADRGKNGGWRLLDEYRKTLLTLTAEEIASLFLPFPESLLRDLGIDRPFRIARQKLFPHLPSPAEPRAQKLWDRNPHRSGTLEGKNRKTRMDDSRAAGGLGGEKTEDRL